MKMPRYSCQSPSPHYWCGQSKRNDAYRPAERPHSQNTAIINRGNAVKKIISTICRTLKLPKIALCRNFPNQDRLSASKADSRERAGKCVVAHAPRPLSGEQPQNTSISTVFSPVRKLLQVVSTITWFPCCFPYYSTFSKLFPSLFESPSGARILSLRAFSYLIYRFAVISLLALIKFYFNIFAIVLK